MGTPRIWSKPQQKFQVQEPAGEQGLCLSEYCLIAEAGGMQNSILLSISNPAPVALVFQLAVSIVSCLPPSAKVILLVGRWRRQMKATCVEWLKWLTSLYPFILLLQYWSLLKIHRTVP